MPEEGAKFNIEKQEAQRDIINVAGDYIIQHPITHEPVYIPTIQTVLRKGETTDGDFFKKEPEWVDYDQGFIVERKEVDEIIKKLETDKVQLVLGAPASGKSIILKNIGYKLANAGKNVYVVELKKHPQDELKLFFENILKIDDESIFIVDDAHLNISECERLIRNFKGRGKGKLIIGSRETKEIIVGEEKESSEFEYLCKKALQIQAEDVTEEMIKTFLKVKHQFDDERIKTVSDNIEKYKQDLWFLSWALKAYNPEKDSVEEDKIYEKIKNEIRKINAEDAFLPLSIFFIFEIPIERYFLEEEMGIEGNIINQLIGLQEIMEKEEIGKHKMLSLNHSSIAELYFGAYQKFPDFGRRIKKDILNGKVENDLKFCLFCQYLTTIDSRNAVDVVNYIGRDWRDEKSGLTLLKKLIKEDKIQKSIESVIDKEDDIKKVGSCVSVIAYAYKELALKLANNIDIEALSSKINKEYDIIKVGRCVSDIAQASKEDALKLANYIDIKVLSLKINEEDNIVKIGFCVSGIADASKEVALKLAYSISARINKEEDIQKVGNCVSSIADASKEVALKLANYIDIKVLSLKINEEDNIVKIGFCVSGIADASNEVALKLANNIDINALSSKLNTEEYIQNVGFCVSGIAAASKEVALELVNNIDINALSSKLNKDEDIDKVGWCLSHIGQASKEVEKKIFNRLNLKLRNELKKNMPYLRNRWKISTP